MVGLFALPKTTPFAVMPTPLVTLPPVVQEVDVNKLGVVVVIPDGIWAIISRKNDIFKSIVTIINLIVYFIMLRVFSDWKYMELSIISF
jgi:hypothetical protein